MVLITAGAITSVDFVVTGTVTEGETIEEEEEIGLNFDSHNNIWF